VRSPPPPPLPQLENDLRALAAESRRTDNLGNLSGIATQISGWLSHTDFGQIKESAERGALRLRSVAAEGKGLGGVRASKVWGCFMIAGIVGVQGRRLHSRGQRRVGSRRPQRANAAAECSSPNPPAFALPTCYAVPWAQEILHPFLLVCESRNPRLVGLALASIQKLLANDAVAQDGRVQILGALNHVRLLPFSSAPQRPALAASHLKRRHAQAAPGAAVAVAAGSSSLPHAGLSSQPAGAQPLPSPMCRWSAPAMRA
jgi:hypothetical protein